MSLDVYITATRPTIVFESNITHNLNKMAAEAGMYEALWRPEEIGIARAGELIPILEKGIEAMRSDPERFKALNPPNGWGSYEVLLDFASRYLVACRENPAGMVEAHG